MLYGFSGPKGSGKDTLANFCDIKLSFAGPLKSICTAVFGQLFDDENKDKRIIIEVTSKHLHTLIIELRKCKDVSVLQELDIITDLHEKVFTSPREVLQYIGTDIVKKYICKNFWLDIMENSLLNIIITDKDVGISDMRFPAERNLIKKLGGKLVLIKRKIILDETDTTIFHISEQSFGSEEEYDIIIKNNKDITHLKTLWNNFRCV